MNANAQVNCDGCGRGRGGGQRRTSETSEANERGARVYRGERPTNDDRVNASFALFREGREKDGDVRDDAIRGGTTRRVRGARRVGALPRRARPSGDAPVEPPAGRRGRKTGGVGSVGREGRWGGGTHDEAREDQRGEVRDERPSRLGLVPPRVPRLLLRRARRRPEQPLRLRAARRDRRDGGHREPASRARGTLPRRAGGRGWCATTKPRATITPSGRRRRREDG